VQYQNTFFVAGTSITYFTLNATGQVQTLGEFFQNNTYVVMGLFVFNNKLVVSLELGGEASFNIGANNVFTLDGAFATLSAPLQAASDNYAYGALYTCRWLTGPIGNYAYYLNTVPTAGLTDIAQGELRTAVLDNTSSTTSAVSATVTASVSTSGVTASTGAVTGTTTRATTGVSVSSGSTTGGSTAATTSLSTSATTTGTTFALHHTITLTYPAGTSITEQDVSDLITRAGGNPAEWTITILSANAGQKVVVEITADAAVVSSTDAIALEQAISTDSTFVSAGGSSSVKVNQKSSSAALFVPLLLLLTTAWL